MKWPWVSRKRLEAAERFASEEHLTAMWWQTTAEQRAIAVEGFHKQAVRNEEANRELQQKYAELKRYCIPILAPHAEPKEIIMRHYGPVFLAKYQSGACIKKVSSDPVAFPNPELLRFDPRQYRVDFSVAMSDPVEFVIEHVLRMVRKHLIAELGDKH